MFIIVRVVGRATLDSFIVIFVGAIKVNPLNQKNTLLRYAHLTQHNSSRQDEEDNNTNTTQSKLKEENSYKKKYHMISSITDGSQ